MLLFILKRVGLAIPTILVVLFIVFIAARLAPTDPVDTIAGEKATLETKARMRHEYGLDRPVLVQFGSYLAGVARGDFGRSFTEGQLPVGPTLAEKFPATVQLAVCALLFALAVGLPVGTLAALYHNRGFDRAAMAFVVALMSVPGIVLGPLLILYVAVRLRWLPVTVTDTYYLNLWLGRPLSVKLVPFVPLILPMLTLGARSAALIARFMRASLLEVLRQDYMRTARAKGLSRGQAVWRHALKNASLPVLTVIGTNFGVLLTGSFVVETIFKVPGIGARSVQSVLNNDYPMIQGTTLLVAIIFLGVNLAVDILYGVIDPRVRAQGGA